MNIVFVGPFGLQPKGTMSVRALSLAKALAQRGHTVAVLIPPWDDRQRAGQHWEDNGVRVENVALPAGIPLLFHILLTRKLVTRALALRPDIIHFFKPKGYAGLAHLLLWVRGQLGKTSARLVVDADDWEQAWNEQLPYSPWQKRFFAWQENWGLSHADTVTVASRALERLVAAHRPGSETDIYYLPNGCRLDDFESSTLVDPLAVREKWQLGHTPTILLYSRFEVFRPGRIVTLVQQVAAQLPEARWLLVGQGLQGEDERLVEQLTQAGLVKYIRFAGWVPADQLPAHFAAADVAIFPYDDTLINRTKCSAKLIDLLTAGVPVVANAVGQNNEYIQDGVSGLLIPPEDDVTFSQAVIDLLKSPARRRELGQGAAQRMREKFSWTELALIAEKAYRHEI